MWIITSLNHCLYISANLIIKDESQYRRHLFLVLNLGNLVVTYPPIRLDSDPENIPDKILTTLEEAITCYSVNCFVASAAIVPWLQEWFVHFFFMLIAANRGWHNFVSQLWYIINLCVWKVAVNALVPVSHRYATHAAFLNCDRLR